MLYNKQDEMEDILINPPQTIKKNLKSFNAGLGPGEQEDVRAEITESLCTERGGFPTSDELPKV